MNYLLFLAADTAQTPEGGPSFLTILPPFLMIAVLFYLMMVRPQQRQDQQKRAMIAALKKNDKIVNMGGIVGIVETIKEKEDEVVLKGGLRITKTSIVRVLGADEPIKEV